MEMKPIDNRSALVVRPKQAMLDWINSLTEEVDDVKSDMEAHDESNIYLIKQTDSIEAGLKWLRKNFKDIPPLQVFPFLPTATASTPRLGVFSTPSALE